MFSEFLAPGAPCEINIDGKTMERTHKELKSPSRFTFDAASEHVYTLLLKKDCYPRFIRSENYKYLLANGVQPSARRRYNTIKYLEYHGRRHEGINPPPNDLFVLFI